MTSLREWLVRMWGSVFGGRSDRDLEEELHFHVDQPRRTRAAPTTVQERQIAVATLAFTQAGSRNRSS